MSVRAHVVHSLPGRTRVRIPSRKGDRGFFERLTSALEAADGLERVRANPATGSVLIVHTADEAGLEAALGRGSVQLVPRAAGPRRPMLARQMADHVQGWDQKVVQATDGALDLETVWFAFLGGAAALQAVRGRVLPAAVSLLMYAGRHLKEARAKSEPAGGGPWDGPGGGGRGSGGEGPPDPDASPSG